MGLDMYLKASTYVRKQDYVDGEPVVTQKFKDTLAVFPELNNSDIYGFEVSRVVMYWRKANAIHNWFVENVQDGVDNCSEYAVPRSALEELRTEIKATLNNKDKAAELLPNVSGFFFGSQEYDEWYFADLQNTLSFLNDALDTDRFEGYDFYYQASW